MKTRLFYCAASVALVLLVVTSAIGATDESEPAPKLESSIPWVAIMYTLVGLGGITAIGFKNSKRTHLD